jgi:ribosome-associated protein
LSTIRLHKPTPILNVDAFNDLLIDAIQDIKGKNIVKLDMRHIHDRPADFFIICEGESNVQVRSIGENIRMRVRAETGTVPNHIEGQAKALWVLVDYFNVIVHVFYKETRQFYELENLWSDAKVTNYENI